MSRFGWMDRHIIITHNALNFCHIQGHDEARSDGIDVIILLLTHSNASHVSLAQQIVESAHPSQYVLFLIKPLIMPKQ